jgi:hypothetical protein
MDYSLAGTLQSAFGAIRHRGILVGRYGFCGDLFQ